MRIKYKLSTPETLRNFAYQALDNHLYIDGWMLKMWLNNLRGTETISLAYDGIIPLPIGIALRHSFYSSEESDHIAVYVKPNYRRLGIGTKLIQTITTEEFDYSSGIRGSLDFFRKVLEKQTKVLSETPNV